MGDIVMGQETACGRRRWRAVVFQDRSQNRRAIERREEWTEAWDKTGVLRREPERAIGTSEERSVEERVNIHQRNPDPADVCNFGGIRVLLVIPKIDGDLRGGIRRPGVDIQRQEHQLARDGSGRGDRESPEIRKERVAWRRIVNAEAQGTVLRRPAQDGPRRGWRLKGNTRQGSRGYSGRPSGDMRAPNQEVVRNRSVQARGAPGGGPPRLCPSPTRRQTLAGLYSQMGPLYPWGSGGQPSHGT